MVKPFLSISKNRFIIPSISLALFTVLVLKAALYAYRHSGQFVGIVHCSISHFWAAVKLGEEWGEMSEWIFRGRHRIQTLDQTTDILVTGRGWKGQRQNIKDLIGTLVVFKYVKTHNRTLRLARTLTAALKA